jgi:uncharacterized protein (TIGR03435 family)
MCLLAGSALISISAGAQENHAGQKPKTQNSNAPQKDFKFEVVSIRPIKPGMQRGGTDLRPSPDGYHTNLSVWQMIMAAYVPGNFEGWADISLLNAPKWLNEDNKYEINARVANEDLDAWQHQGGHRELLRAALRNVLKERCKLVIHMQPKEFPDYKLVISKRGTKLMENAPDPKLPQFEKLPDGGYISITEWNGRRIAEEYFHGATMEDFCSNLSRSVHPPIHDGTGLTGRYDFRLRIGPSDYSGDVLTPARVDLLGLDIKPGKYQGFSIVIDRVEKPDAN